MDVNQLLIITRFLEIHTSHGEDVACAWAARVEAAMEAGCSPSLEGPLSSDMKPHLRIVGS